MPSSVEALFSGVHPPLMASAAFMRAGREVRGLGSLGMWEFGKLEVSGFGNLGILRFRNWRIMKLQNGEIPKEPN